MQFATGDFPFVSWSVTKLVTFFLYRPLITENIFWLCMIHNIHFTSFFFIVNIITVYLHPCYTRFLGITSKEVP